MHSITILVNVIASSVSLYNKNVAKLYEENMATLTQNRKRLHAGNLLNVMKTTHRTVITCVD